MRKRICFALLVGLVLLIGTETLHAQEKDKIVILSSRVGPVLDAAKRDHYNLFQEIKDFNRGIVYQTPAKTYYARITLVGKDGKVRDTTVQYSESYLLMLAEHIDHFEDLEKGVYQMGQQPATLKVVEPQTRVGTKPPELQSDILPFASKAEDFEAESSQLVGFAIGLSTYSPDFTGLRAAFRGIAEKYREQGYSVSDPSVDLNVSHLLWYSTKIRLYKALALLLDVGKSIDGDVEVKAVSASLLYHFRPFDVPWFRPYLGAGVGSYHFSVSNNYGEGYPISPVSRGGTYTYLEAITSEGGNSGFTLDGGIELIPRGGPSLVLYANWLLVPSVETNSAEGEKANVKLSSIIAGARIIVYL